MSEFSASPSRETNSSFDPVYLARGRRLIGWLSGKTHLIWPHEPWGAPLIAMSRMTGRGRSRAAYAGPIAPRTAFGKPPLSWFEVSLDDDRADPLGAAIERTLQTLCSCDDAAMLRLMRRLLDSDALHTRIQPACLPEEGMTADSGLRILVLDEPLRSASAPREKPRQRMTAFRKMLGDMRDAYPDAEIWLAPSSSPGRGEWLSSMCRVPPDIRRLPASFSLHAWLPHVDAVYTLGASEGMAAVLAGCPTHVYGRPYYAGWGFTVDHQTFAARRARPSLARWFDAVFMRLARYLNIECGQPGTLEQLLDIIELQHRTTERFAYLDRVVGVRFQWWKRRLATPYLTAGGGTLRWVNRPESVSSDECAVLWGARSTVGLPPGVRVCRIEDGFVHSNALGSDMSQPYSQVIDGSHLYFDASAPNDLTHILNTATFDAAELARASRLRATIVALGITKYNLGRRRPSWAKPANRLVVLVPGQVSDDASIRLGTGSINTAAGLLEAARARRPDAFIVYKPHPDVLSGNRNGLVHARQFADIVDVDADIISLIESCDEIHTLSSLAGFDALLRGKVVFTYGMPFYAGWGLTHDALQPQPWRHRSLTLDMLTAGALIRYPIYWDWRRALYTTPEAVIRLIAPAAQRPLKSLGHSRTRLLVKIFRWTTNALAHLWWRCQHRRVRPKTRRVS
ncbi:capsular biosynthesis protein [Burkholderia glumae]|uniref:capsular polysaccharide export protein, LipB/KpsS family n=1 Tax=Burkholderia glumae TaxID=337 RepID=UPI00148E919D|nr:capsular biosynthesis protein [Burkholderia glumae]MCQ0031958.1 capsular biosynthesis protein [Burkholderia glumae]MCQ0037044.1 capsular biosynthesis protein [Burkholderia glumae]QJW78496.1 capsular biosynthesis protein [Burkholderia glumae]UVS83434.1 capsular biosynthesis protein [Burkholderia glumae]